MQKDYFMYLQLETNDKQKFRIPNRCGGPPVWETAGTFVAVPLWIYDDRKGLLHRLGVVNAIKKDLTIFSRGVGTLNLHSFDMTLIYQAKNTSFVDIQKERIDKVVKLGAPLPLRRSSADAGEGAAQELISQKSRWG